MGKAVSGVKRKHEEGAGGAAGGAEAVAAVQAPLSLRHRAFTSGGEDRREVVFYKDAVQAGEEAIEKRHIIKATAVDGVVTLKVWRHADVRLGYSMAALAEFAPLFEDRDFHGCTREFAFWNSDARDKVTRLVLIYDAYVAVYDASSSTQVAFSFNAVRGVQITDGKLIVKLRHTPKEVLLGFPKDGKADDTAHAVKAALGLE